MITQSAIKRDTILGHLGRLNKFVRQFLLTISRSMICGELSTQGSLSRVDDAVQLVAVQLTLFSVFLFIASLALVAGSLPVNFMAAFFLAANFILLHTVVFARWLFSFGGALSAKRMCTVVWLCSISKFFTVLCILFVLKEFSGLFIAGFLVGLAVFQMAPLFVQGFNQEQPLLRKQR